MVTTFDSPTALIHRAVDPAKAPFVRRWHEPFPLTTTAQIPVERIGQPLAKSTTNTTPASPAEIRNAFLSSVYDCSSRSEVGLGSLLVVKHIDELLRGGDFAEVDRTMLYADVSLIDPEIAFAFLTITVAAKQKLNRTIRQFFAECTKFRLAEQRDMAYVTDLLRRYE